MVRINPRTTQAIAKSVIWAAALLVMLLLLFIISFILFKGVPALSWQFLSESPSDMGRAGGILSTIVGTLLVTAVAIIVAAPLGIGTAIFLTEYMGEGKITRIIRFSADSLAGIPSIVYGLFGFIFFVIYLNLGWSILSGGLTMAVMIVPTIIRTSEEAILSVPSIYRQASFSLGATKLQTIIKVVTPSAFPGIVTGIILGIGRCVGETAVVILTAGASLRMPDSLFSPVRTMSVHFYILEREGTAPEKAYGTAALLIILILLINIAANMIINRYASRNR